MAYLDLNQFGKPVVYKDDNMEVHTLNGKLHRLDGPAVKTATHQEWYVNGKLHRDDGPARQFKIAPDGNTNVCEWWWCENHNEKSEYRMHDILDDETFHKHWHKETK